MRDTGGDLARLAAAAGGKSLGVVVPGMEKPARRSKYNAQRTEYAGVLYDSKSEAARAAELDLLMREGYVRYWGRQMTFALGCPENSYRCDFYVFGKDWFRDGRDSFWVEDVKGFSPPAFKKNVRLWRKYGPCELRIIMRGKVELVPGGAGSKLDV